MARTLCNVRRVPVLAAPFPALLGIILVVLCARVGEADASSCGGSLTANALCLTNGQPNATLCNALCSSLGCGTSNCTVDNLCSCNSRPGPLLIPGYRDPFCTTVVVRTLCDTVLDSTLQFLTGSKVSSACALACTTIACGTGACRVVSDSPPDGPNVECVCNQPGPGGN